MSTRIFPDDVLEALLAETGETIAVPDGAARAAVAAARQGVAGEQLAGRRRHLGSRGRWVRAVAGLGALVVVGVTVAAHHGGGPQQASPTAASAASVPAYNSAPVLGDATRSAASAGPQDFSAQGGSAVAASPTAAPSASGAASGAAASTSDAVVIRTGNAALVVPKSGVAKAVAALTGDATGLGGYLQDSNTQSGNATVTLRVPAPKFEALLAELPSVGTVSSTSSSSQDVTGQSVDLAARLKAAQASRDTYLTILSKANSIGDVLSVQQRLDGLQTQIEQLQAQQKTLDAQASFATLAVNVTEKADVVPPTTPPAGPRTGFNLAGHQAGGGFTGGLQDVVAAGGTIALLLLAALILYPLGRVGFRRYQRALL